MFVNLRRQKKSNNYLFDIGKIDFIDQGISVKTEGVARGQLSLFYQCQIRNFASTFTLFTVLALQRYPEFCTQF